MTEPSVTLWSALGIFITTTGVAWFGFDPASDAHIDRRNARLGG